MIKTDDNFESADKHTWCYMVKHYLSLAAPAVGQNILMLLVW